MPPGPWRPLVDKHPMFFACLGCLKSSGGYSPLTLGFPSHKKKLSVQPSDLLNFDLWLSLLHIASHKDGHSQGQGCAPNFITNITLPMVPC